MTSIVSVPRPTKRFLSSVAEGAVTNKSSFNHCLDFFALAASMRENPQDAVKLFEKAFFEDKQTAIRILFWIRDIRGGQGEREIFRKCLNHLIDLEKNIQNTKTVF